MEIGDLYQFVLMLVLIAMILGVGILVLDKFLAADATTTEAATAINATINSMTPIASTWLPLIVTITVLAIILTLVIRSFSQSR